MSEYSTAPEPVAEVAERLAPAPVVAIDEVRKGGNSRIFRVATAIGEFALKKYPANDQRDRQGAEARALRFFARAGLSDTPRLVALDENARMSLLSWLDGTAIPAPSDADIEQFAAFQIRLDRAIDEVARREIGAASEVCVSGLRILSHIQSRLEGLLAIGGQIPELNEFLSARFRPALATSVDRARRAYKELGSSFDQDLPRKSQTLIASDFGTHNALRNPDGRVSFVDFEYFGWDDPLTSIGNFVLHPGMRLAAHQQNLYRRMLLAHFGEGQESRLLALLPLFALRWCVIVLSELLPERRQHRNEANAPTGGWEEIRTRQLAKARDLLTYADCD